MGPGSEPGHTETRTDSDPHTQPSAGPDVILNTEKGTSAAASANRKKSLKPQEYQSTIQGDEAKRIVSKCRMQHPSKVPNVSSKEKNIWVEKWIKNNAAISATPSPRLARPAYSTASSIHTSQNPSKSNVPSSSPVSSARIIPNRQKTPKSSKLSGPFPEEGRERQWTQMFGFCEPIFCGSQKSQTMKK
jgi:hypothetical protein